MSGPEAAEPRYDEDGDDDDHDDEEAKTAIDPAQIGGMTRLYEKDFPDDNDLVVVVVREIAEMGAYVELLEYNNIQGMILLSELSRRRIRSINRFLRVGRQEVVMVIRVDRAKGASAPPLSAGEGEGANGSVGGGPLVSFYSLAGAGHGHALRAHSTCRLH